MVGLLEPAIYFAFFFLAIIWKASDKPSGTRFVVMLIVPVAAALSGTLLLAWQAGLTIALGGWLTALGCEARGRRIGAVAALAAAVAIVTITGLRDIEAVAKRREALRRQYPLVSIGDRLAYEAKTPATGAPAPTLAPLVEQNLEEAEARGQYASRGRVLERIHAGEPINASMTPHLLNDLEKDLRMLDGRSIELASAPRRSGGCGSHEAPPPPAPEPQYVPQPSPQPEYASVPTMTAPPRDMIAAMHQGAAGDFLDPERFGLVRDRDHVAGFQSHRFTSMPAFGMQTGALTLGGAPDVAASPAAIGDWSLERVDLVSLRKPSGPAVYLSENLPKVDALKTADTRLLDDFETRALARLRIDEDVVIEQSDGTLRMLGALRAGNHCTRCHAGSRGELIGALSYELHHKNRPTQLAEQQ